MRSCLVREMVCPSDILSFILFFVCSVEDGMLTHLRELGMGRFQVVCSKLMFACHL
jgi:hypothetical protein